MALLTLCACGNKTNGTGDGADSTAILDSIAQVDSIQKADSAAVTSFLTNLYKVVLNVDNAALKLKASDMTELESHFTADVKKRLDTEDPYGYDESESASGINLAELRTGNQDGPSDVSKLLGISKEGEWWVVNYSDMGIQAATKLKAEVKDGKVIITDYARADGKASTASASPSGKVDEVEQAVRDFEKFSKEVSPIIASGKLDPMSSPSVAAEVQHVYAYEDQWTPAQRKRVEKAEKEIY